MNIELVYDEKTSKYSLAPVSDDQPNKAEMEQSAVASIQKPLQKAADFEIAGLPLGGIGVGFAGTYLIDKLVGDQLGKWGDMGNLAAALAVAYLGPKFIGKEASKWISAVIIYEVAKPHMVSMLDKVWPVKTTTEASTPEVVAEQSSGMRQNTAYRDLGIYQDVF